MKLLVVTSTLLGLTVPTSSRLSALERHASSTAKAKAKKAKKAKRGINTKLKGMAGFQGFGQMPKV